MKLLSVNVSQPKTIIFNGKNVETSIFKTPVDTPAYVDAENINGNQQADLKNHGGPDKAVYAYGLNHYTYWQHYLDSKEPLIYGALGETLTFDTLDEQQLCIGDILQINDVVLAVSQFRVPCFKLGAKFNKAEIVAEFMHYAHTGAYFKVLQTGHINKGDAVNIISKDPHNISVKALFEACFKPATTERTERLKKASQIEHLAEEWREKILKKLAAKQK